MRILLYRKLAYGAPDIYEATASSFFEGVLFGPHLAVLGDPMWCWDRTGVGHLQGK